MARPESKMIMGYLPIEERHYPALLSLIAPATPAVKLLDPFAGEGAFLEAAAKAWNVTPYANELDGERAAACITRFGATQAVRCDVERLVASNNAFGILWANPPYDYDKATRGSKRVELAYLRHAWKWAQDGALVLWCIYNQHITEEAATFLAKHSQTVEVWALPGKHQGEYDQVVVVAVKGIQPEPSALYESILRQKADPRPLTVQPEPHYKVPPPHPIQRFVFTADMIEPQQGLRLIEQQGAWKSNAFQALLEAPSPPMPIEPVVPPRPGHLALVLAAGVADGAVINTEVYGPAALRGKTHTVEEIARVEVENDPNHPELQVKRTTLRLKPTTTLTLLANDGTVVEMEGDEALLGFITANKRALTTYLNGKFKPLYPFDFDGMGPWLDNIKLKGRHDLYTAQKHVVAAVTCGLRTRDSLLLVGSMGVGKAQPLDARVLTPTGWRLMGDLQIGDLVVNPEGGVTHVIGVFPQGEKDIYRVTFSDGAATECCREHLWLVNSPYRKWAGQSGRVQSLDVILKQGLCHANGNYQHFIPMAHPVDFTPTPLALDPYLLGVLLGDGGISRRDLRFTSADLEIVDQVQQRLPAGMKIRALKRYDYRFLCGPAYPAKGRTLRSPLKKALRALGLLGHRAATKFIPPTYLYAALADRIALLQGLLDTDGSVASARGSGVEFVTVSWQLAEDMRELIRSLGGKASLARKAPTYPYQGVRRQGQIAYRLYISLPPVIVPFRLPRKAVRYRPPSKYLPTRALVAVTPVGRKSAQCIALDSANQLYVTDDYLVTHNTAMGGTAAIAIAGGVVKSMQDAMRPDQVVLIVAPPHLVEKWKRELTSIHANIVVERLDRHEDVKAFMQQAERLGPGIAKIGLIKRDLTKLGSGHEPAVVWRMEAEALWQADAPTPDGYDPHQRIRRERIPHCPHCGSIVLQEKKGVSQPASENWLRSGRRMCAVCQNPLWQEARDRGSQPKPGFKFPVKNPRYRLDEYLKRRYRDRIYLLVWDEVHEAQHSDTGNGEAFSRMAGLAQKVLAMTGTPFNGRSSSIFNLEYALNPRVRERYAWGGAPRLSRKLRGSARHQQINDENAQQRGRAESRWVADMGVREQAIEERPTYDRETGAYTGTSTYERPYEEAPGISPLLIAEVLDHAIFFSLGDLGKWLPKYEEIAVPVELDGDLASEYERTKKRLKDYLVQRRWEGDTSFRGAYLQWSMGWLNAPFRPYEVTHNLKHPITGEKLPYIVASVPSYGEDRIYAKEQALIDLVRAELAENRPCVIYLRQTATRDIQPRIEALLRQHIPGANIFILSNRVDAERREAVIEREIARGVNVVICNPELVKTGLDLIYFPTLIFAEIVFNLSTMMQSAGRSYRLNQTHQHCKVYYLFAENTMEQTAVQLMSRKQRAAKLLTGDIGLTGLDALTESEGGFEEALLEAIGRDEALLDPAQLFKTDSQISEIDADDAAYWNVETVTSAHEVESAGDSLLDFARQEFDVMISPLVNRTPIHLVADGSEVPQIPQPISTYLAEVCLWVDEARFIQLYQTLLNGFQNAEERITGLHDPEYAQSTTARQELLTWMSTWLAQQHLVFPGCEAEVAETLLSLAGDPLTTTHSVTAAISQHLPSASKIIDLTQRPEFERLVQRHDDVEEAPLRQLALF